MKICVHTKSLMLMWTVTAFVITKHQKQPNVPQLGNGKTNCGTSIHWNLFSKIRRNKVLVQARAWKHFKGCAWIGISQFQKAIYCIISYIYKTFLVILCGMQDFSFPQPALPALEDQSLNHWTTREVPVWFNLYDSFENTKLQWQKIGSEY